MVHLSVPGGVDLASGGARSAAIGGGHGVRARSPCAVGVGGFGVFAVFVSGVGLLAGIGLGSRCRRCSCALLLAELGASVLEPHLEKWVQVKKLNQHECLICAKKEEEEENTTHLKLLIIIRGFVRFILLFLFIYVDIFLVFIVHVSFIHLSSLYYVFASFTLCFIFYF